MTSTHAGNPVCCAAALASLQVIDEEHLVDQAKWLGDFLHENLHRLKLDHETIGAVHGKGLVAGLHIVEPQSGAPDSSKAAEVVYECFIRGLLLFAPLGFGGATIKICPPLSTPEAGLKEGLEVLEESLCAVSESRSTVR